MSPGEMLSPDLGDDRRKERLELLAQALIDTAKQDGFVVTIELRHRELRMGGYEMVPHVRKRVVQP